MLFTIYWKGLPGLLGGIGFKLIVHYLAVLPAILQSSISNLQSLILNPLKY